jgi:hypothetical protein
MIRPSGPTVSRSRAGRPPLWTDEPATESVLPCPFEQPDGARELGLPYLEVGDTLANLLLEAWADRCK